MSLTTLRDLLTPEKVISAYQETKIHPRQQCFFRRDDNNRFGCPIGALSCQQESTLLEQIELDMVDCLDVLYRDTGILAIPLEERAYIEGFTRGFDGQIIQEGTFNWWRPALDALEEGYRRGTEVSLAILNAGL